ncbi:hypothetical protein ACWERV_16865 [Streptomyces sp. NPDC004031]
MTGAVYTVREYLDAPLRQTQRTADLEALTRRFAGQPLPGTVADLRAALREGIGMEDFRRLHILISQLYHQCNASIPLTRCLRAEVSRALTRSRRTTRTREEETRVL